MELNEKYPPEPGPVDPRARTLAMMVLSVGVDERGDVTESGRIRATAILRGALAAAWSEGLEEARDYDAAFRDPDTKPGPPPVNPFSRGCF